ncbi:PadR family transcriptional regulator [Clostridium sp. D2Q-11]|uniref:PadR family transcriptional regulator n=1 Tax=Anaeromonas frigoriresistens TaxID=2683708 RepID=A0A942Z567_9FIRM|nr:PadR family transcriptional regulator [Anaeromonas frigoriresistens]MBS4537096.1 PadR family transcriptional regulator [Anaeromonas frigoriresistens]
MTQNTQLLKGILEGCILEVISINPIYGYELSVKLQEYDLNVSEGSIYPVLLRLQKKKLIKGEVKKSPNGPNRKYYYLTEEGIKSLEDFKENWNKIRNQVDNLLNWEELE